MRQQVNTARTGRAQLLFIFTWQRLQDPKVYFQLKFMYTMNPEKVQLLGKK